MEPAKVEEWKESIKNRMNNFVSRIFHHESSNSFDTDVMAPAIYDEHPQKRQL